MSEPEYLRALQQDAKASLVQIEIVKAAGVPKTIVQIATEKRKQAETAARKLGDRYLAFDEVWCVFDRDSHPNVKEAQIQARDNKLRTAFSNPCFELWILLHFQDQFRGEHRDQIRTLCKKYLPSYDKHIEFEKLKALYEDARKRAAALLKWQRDRGCDLENPWTEVHLLTESILEFSSKNDLETVLANSSLFWTHVLNSEQKRVPRPPTDRSGDVIHWRGRV